MILFRNFTLPLWKMFAGNFLLLVCSLFYLAWWVVEFRPNASGSSSGSLYLMAAFAIGVAGIALMVGGTGTLSRDSDSQLVMYIVLGTSVLFFILLAITTVVFHRPITSELLIIHVWAAVELSAAAALYNSNRFGPVRASVMAALVGIATIIGLVCYLLYYRLDETASYRAGMVPLVTDAIVVAVFQVVMAFS